MRVSSAKLHVVTGEARAEDFSEIKLFVQEQDVLNRLFHRVFTNKTLNKF